MHSLNGLGCLGLSLLIALTSLESSPIGQERHSWRFIPISIAGTGITCLLGGLFGHQLAYFFPSLVGTKQNLNAFSLAMGLSLSVTALPILIAVVRDTGLSGSRIGNLATNCALLDDLWMWLLLAVNLSLVNAGAQTTWLMMYLLIYLGVMFLFIKPLLKRLFEKNGLAAGSDGLLTAITLICLSCIATDLMGLHTIFGAYIAGVVLPRPAWISWRESILQFSQVLLLPFFFILTGMRLQIQITDIFFWQLTLIVTVVATACKFCSVVLSARLTGLKWLESAILGSLMQCKGLMELVVVNILYEAGIISQILFSALAMMALISTFITVPSMLLLLGRKKPSNHEIENLAG